MSSLDHAISHLGNGGIAVGLLVALLLGLRHATDPDHLTAVITLTAGDDRNGPRRATALGLTWGLGHATTLLVLGIPAVLLHPLVQGPLQRAIEASIGLVIVALALRLLLGRRSRAHAHRAPRSPLLAFGVGALHGAGGSAAVGILLAAAVPGRVAATLALVIFALATAASMASASAAFAYGLARSQAVVSIDRIVPVLGLSALLFGLWYALV